MRTKPRTRAAIELARIMTARRLTQQAVADLLSQRVGRRVSQSSVNRALTGTSPGGDLLSAYAVLFGLDVALWSEPADSQAA
ncbi:MAG TPA: hypothetical protein PLR99_00235 [Polyangiaceae bacterium]|nr:hypothetical protein [Polyangiaceae bacterium]